MFSILSIRCVRGMEVNLQPLKGFGAYGSVVHTPTALFPEKGHNVYWAGLMAGFSVHGCVEKHFSTSVGI